MHEVRIKLIDAEPLSKRQITDPASCIMVMQDLFGDLASERVVAAFLNNSNQVMNYAILGCGESGFSYVSLNTLFQAALLQNTGKIILFHNHPSQNLVPSQEDIAMTERIIGLAHLFNIEVLDHVILGINKTHSMARNNDVQFDSNIYSRQVLSDLRGDLMSDQENDYEASLERLKQLCEKNGRGLSIDKGHITTFDRSDGTDDICFDNFDDAIEWEEGYIDPNQPPKRRRKR